MRAMLPPVFLMERLLRKLTELNRQLAPIAAHTLMEVSSVVKSESKLLSAASARIRYV